MGKPLTRQVFVAYPYNIYPGADYRRVYQGVGREFDVRFVFADEKVSGEPVIPKLMRELLSADFSVFDISGWNPNVALELGMAYAMDAPLYICYNPAHDAHKDVPSNLRGISRIQYDSMSKLENGLVKMLDQQYPRRPQSLEEHAARMHSAVSELLKAAGDKGLSAADISEALQCGNRMARVIVEEMMESGRASSTGKGRGMRYVIKRAAKP